MYAVIETGGKQYKVEEGDVLEVERVDGDEQVFTPVLLVDGGDVRATPDELEGVAVVGRVLGEAKGKKVTGFTYKAKTNNRRRYGHRQRYARVEITGIRIGGKSGRPGRETVGAEPSESSESPAGSAE